MYPLWQRTAPDLIPSGCLREEVLQTTKMPFVHMPVHMPVHEPEHLCTMYHQPIVSFVRKHPLSSVHYMLLLSLVYAKGIVRHRHTFCSFFPLDRCEI
jgi:hypothetical protein